MALNALRRPVIYGKGLQSLTPLAFHRNSPLTLNPAGVRHGSSRLKEIKRKLKSVISVEKLTKTLKLVATARLRSFTNRAMESRPFHAGLLKVQAPVTRLSVEERKSKEDLKKKVLFLLISSDKGLCGAVNSMLTRHVRNLIREAQDADVVIIGDKGKGPIVREFPEKIVMNVSELNKKKAIFFADCVRIGAKVLQLGKDYRKIVMFYNRFQSSVTYIQTQEEILTFNNMAAWRDNFTDYQTNGNRFWTWESLCEYFVGAQIYHAVVEGAASETGSRMMSMDNASKNAAKMIKKYTTDYNNGRQAGITAELAEIVSGTETLLQNERRKKLAAADQ